MNNPNNGGFISNRNLDNNLLQHHQQQLQQQQQEQQNRFQPNFNLNQERDQPQQRQQQQHNYDNNNNNNNNNNTSTTGPHQHNYRFNRPFQNQSYRRPFNNNRQYNGRFVQPDQNHNQQQQRIGRGRGRGGIRRQRAGGRQGGQGIRVETNDQQQAVMQHVEAMEVDDQEETSESEERTTRKRQNIELEARLKRNFFSGFYTNYFPTGPPQLPEVEKKILIISNYLESNGYFDSNQLTEIEDSCCFTVKYESILADPIFINGWPDFSSDLYNLPQQVINLWSSVMHKKVIENIQSVDDNLSSTNSIINCDDMESIYRIETRMLKANPVTPIISINSYLVGKLITIRGVILATKNIKPLCIQMCFLCKKCGSIFGENQPNGIYTLPSYCKNFDNCTNTSQFEPQEEVTPQQHKSSNANSTIMIDSQIIRIQDIEHRKVETGTVPKTIDCLLTNELVNRCITGSAVTITGIVQTRKENNIKGEQNLHNFYIKVIALIDHRQCSRTMNGHWFSFSNKDYQAISLMHDTENLFELLVASLCPSIYGQQMVKAALLLSLFGGTPNDEDGDNRKNNLITKRTDINILLVGDPGMGKSQMLKIITDIAPRGYFVCGTGSSIAGLTVTLTKDGSQEYTVEPGALVMSDNGVCCIDEFDKMQSQHCALLEAMEQQTVSIAKSGVFRTFQSRTTVIAAANPSGGHYDHKKSILENIKIPTALLSRFDITFILLDTPNKEKDRKITEHIMGIISDQQQVQLSQPTPLPSTNNFLIQIPLCERLQKKIKGRVDVIPPRLLQKYIAYAKRYVYPKISDEAKVILKEYYLKLQTRRKCIESIPVTIRQLESLIRLTQARAKCELRETATLNDAKDVLEIYESSLENIQLDTYIKSGISQYGNIFPSSSSLSSSSSTKITSRSGTIVAQGKKLIAELQKIARQHSKNIFSVHEIKETIKVLQLSADPLALISIMNREGYLLLQSRNVYKLQTYDM